MTEFEEKRELYNKVQNNEIKLENLNDKGKKAYLTYGIDSGLIDKNKIDNDILKKYNLTDTITYNGVEYNCEAKTAALSNVEVVYLGNDVVVEGEPTDHPFGIINFSSDIAVAMGVSGGVLALDGSE